MYKIFSLFFSYLFSYCRSKRKNKSTLIWSAIELCILKDKMIFVYEATTMISKDHNNINQGSGQPDLMNPPLLWRSFPMGQIFFVVLKTLSRSFWNPWHRTIFYPVWSLFTFRWSGIYYQWQYILYFWLINGDCPECERALRFDFWRLHAISRKFPSNQTDVIRDSDSTTSLRRLIFDIKYHFKHW